MIQQHSVTVTEHDTRIDKLLTGFAADVSRSQIQSWITDGYVHVNGAKVKTNYKCQTGDALEWTVPDPEPVTIEPENLPLDIIYEDADLLIVNKPSGMVVHPSAGHSSGTLVNALLYHCDSLSHINGAERPGIVHRIDKDTSGLLLVAKNDTTHQSLAEQLSNRAIVREYESIADGVIEHETGVIDAPIGRDPHNRKKMDVVDSGKPAVTHFRVVNRFAAATHVRCQLETGRTHQIRVHMAYIGFPVVGDPKYGKRKTLNANGQALHAASLDFRHPSTHEQLHFEADAPDYFQDLLAYFNEKML